MRISNGRQPNCQLTHELINQLMVLTIYCGLLAEEGRLDAETLTRLRVIRAAAQSIAEALSFDECERETIEARELATLPIPS
jgi:hypothetical protein